MATPSAPLDGRMMVCGSCKIMFAWQAPESDGGSPITTYALTLTPENMSPTLYTITDAYYEATDLLANVPIQATVKASNDNGLTYGPEYTFLQVTPIEAPSAAPASATASVVSEGTAEITWEPAPIAPQGICNYLVMAQSLNPSDPSVGIATSSLEQTSCQIAELNPTSEYFFTVCIVNQVGRSPVATTNTVSFMETPVPLS